MSEKVALHHPRMRLRRERISRQNGGAAAKWRVKLSASVIKIEESIARSAELIFSSATEVPLLGEARNLLADLAHEVLALLVDRQRLEVAIGERLCLEGVGAT